MELAAEAESLEEENSPPEMPVAEEAKSQEGEIPLEVVAAGAGGSQDQIQKKGRVSWA